MKITASGFSSTVAVLAAALGFGLAGTQRGEAAPVQEAPAGPTLTLLSPAPRATFQGVRPVEISAFYQGTAGNGIVSLELYIDGVRAQSKTLDAPEAKGVVSFLVDASLLSKGAHLVVVRATAADAEVSSVRGTFTYNDQAGAGANPVDALDRPTSPADGTSPVLRLVSPAPDSKVQGTVVIRAEASDASGKPPYVSIFVDGEMKQLVNYRPFEYDWDTTALPNGWHTLTVVEAFDSDAQPVAHVKPIQVFVNNPGGATTIRHDLLDAGPAAPRQAAIPRKTTASVALARRPQGSALPATITRMARMAADNGHWNTLSSASLPVLSDPFTSAPKAVTRTTTPMTGFKPLRPRMDVAAAAERMIRMARVELPDSDLTSTLLPLVSTEAPVAAPRPVAVEVASPAATPHALRLALPAMRLMTPRLNIHIPQLPLRAVGQVRLHTALGAASLLQSAGQTRVVLNQSTMPLERPLVARQGVLFGPLRRIFEAGGGSLQWTSRTGVVRAQTGAKDIRMTIGDKAASINQRPLTLDSAPYLSAGRTMVPVSLIGEALDASVQFDPATGHLKITSRR